MIENKVLTQSCLSDRIWSLAVENLEEFHNEAERYFALVYPGFTIAKFDYEKRMVWLRDER